MTNNTSIIAGEIFAVLQFLTPDRYRAGDRGRDAQGRNCDPTSNHVNHRLHHCDVMGAVGYVTGSYVNPTANYLNSHFPGGIINATREMSYADITAELERLAHAAPARFVTGYERAS